MDKALAFVVSRPETTQMVTRGAARFYFAVAPEFPRHILAEGPGLIVADAFGGAILAEPTPEPLSGPRRKSLTLAFARLAALRATGI
jgi:hypothetical protein